MINDGGAIAGKSNADPDYSVSCPFLTHLGISSAPSWSGISTELLRAELARRDEDPPKPSCGSGIKGSYNTSAHVFALILILALSTIGFCPQLQLERSDAD